MDSPSRATCASYETMVVPPHVLKICEEHINSHRRMASIVTYGDLIRVLDRRDTSPGIIEFLQQQISFTMTSRVMPKQTIHVHLGDQVSPDIFAPPFIKWERPLVEAPGLYVPIQGAHIINTNGAIKDLGTRYIDILTNARNRSKEEIEVVLKRRSNFLNLDLNKCFI